MGSQWFCKVEGGEAGPIGLPEMVEMVRAGRLKQDDPVRREGSSEWIPARTIASLFRVAGKETVEPEPSHPQAEPEPAPSSADAAPAAETSPTGKGAWLWLGVALLVVVSVAMGVWRWSSRGTARLPEPGPGGSQPGQKKEETQEKPDDSVDAFSDAIAAFSKVVGGDKTGTTEVFSFTPSGDVSGIAVSYKCHSQSESNYAENTVKITIRRGAEVLGECLDSYESQTDWGDVMKAGFWHSQEFPEITLKAGDRVDLSVTAKAGDWRNFVSEIKICPRKRGVSYPNDRGFHASR